MEPWAALLHGWVWHSALWRVHRSHHQGPRDIAPRVHQSRWEANDILSLTHAPLAVAAILYGCVGPPGTLREVLYGVGLGMTLFGVGYVLVHDGLAHDRLPVRGLLRWRYMRRVCMAHRVHHRTGRAPFGLFLGPWALPRPATLRRQAQKVSHGDGHRDIEAHDFKQDS